MLPDMDANRAGPSTAGPSRTDGTGGDPEILRERLVGGLVAAGRIGDDRLAAAFRAVPRHLFLPGVDPATAYRDEAVPTKWAADGRPISSSSQPAVMAAMLTQLAVRPGHRVLEIGAGTGYNAALLAELAGPAGAVTTVDIDADTVEQARRNLAAAGVTGVTVGSGDGAAGWPAAAPYDRIILTAGARDLAPAWIAQLAGGGRLVLPLSLRGVQRSVAFERAADHLVSVSVLDCGFMPLRGTLAGPDPVRPLGAEPGHFLQYEGDLPVDPAALLAAIRRGPGRPGPAVDVSPREIRGGLRLWLALYEPAAADVAALGPAAERMVLPPVTAFPGMGGVPVLLGPGSLAALAPADRPGAVLVRGYGPAGDELAARLLARVREWDAAGRPSSAGLTIRAHPRTGPVPGGAGPAGPVRAGAVRAGTVAAGPAPAGATGAATIELPYTRLVLERG